jgi:hypothetical protein
MEISTYLRNSEVELKKAHGNNIDYKHTVLTASKILTRRKENLDSNPLMRFLAGRRMLGFERTLIRIITSTRMIILLKTRAMNPL